MKKKVVLLATFAIIAGSSVLFAINRNSSAKSDCCRQSSCNGQACNTECSCGGDCVGENCECGCSCCK